MGVLNNVQGQGIGSDLVYSLIEIYGQSIAGRVLQRRNILSAFEIRYRIVVGTCSDL